jgi:hypothetical protein
MFSLSKGAGKRQRLRELREFRMKKRMPIPP